MSQDQPKGCCPDGLRCFFAAENEKAVVTHGNEQEGGAVQTKKRKASLFVRGLDRKAITVNKKRNIVGFLYFFIHLIVEVTTFYVVTRCTNDESIWFLALLYDFLAFVPQGAFGYLKDRGVKINLAAVGMILTGLSLALLHFECNATVIILVLSIGNCLVHVQGAETTLRSSDGKMTPSALFVAGGSFGVVTGKMLATNNVSILYVAAIHLMMLVLLLLCRRYADLIDEKNLEAYNFTDPNRKNRTVLLLAVLVVVVRSYMGYGIPTTWNKTQVQTVLLYCAMGVGKALGGVLIDRIGVRKTALISTIGALPFLLAGNNLMMVSLIGVMLFSMTMAVSLGLLVSRLKEAPGVAFGLTTIGLFLGTVPVFVYRTDSVLVNCITVAGLTLASVVILQFICRKERA